MIAFHSLQSDRGRHARKQANVSMVQIHVTNCTAKLRGYVHEAEKIQCNNLQGAGQAYAAGLIFYAEQALPLVRTRILRLAQISPIAARSPARRSRDGRATSGKTTGEISRVMSAQLPGNSRATATAMPPDGRADNSQANLPCAGLGRAISARILARRLATRSRDNRATVKATSCKTTRSNLNHDIQRL